MLRDDEMNALSVVQCPMYISFILQPFSFLIPHEYHPPSAIQLLHQCCIDASAYIQDRLAGPHHAE